MAVPIHEPAVLNLAEEENVAYIAGRANGYQRRYIAKELDIIYRRRRTGLKGFVIGGIVAATFLSLDLSLLDLLWGKWVLKIFRRQRGRPTINSSN